MGRRLRPQVLAMRLGALWGVSACPQDLCHGSKVEERDNSDNQRSADSGLAILVSVLHQLAVFFEILVDLCSFCASSLQLAVLAGRRFW